MKALPETCGDVEFFVKLISKRKTKGIRAKIHSPNSCMKKML